VKPVADVTGVLILPELGFSTVSKVRTTFTLVIDLRAAVLKIKVIY
jgi:hypothetical protein